MSIAISEEHRALAQTVAGLLTKHQSRAAARSLLDAGTEPMPAFWAELGGLGLLGLHVPEELGGSGFGLAETLVVAEQMGRHLAPGPFVPTVIASAVLAAEAAGVAAETTEQAAGYAKIREQFGRPIATFQAVKHHCANMLVASELAAGAAWDAGRAGTGGGDQFSYTAAIAATLAVPAAAGNASLNIQVHGGIGFTWEHDAHLYLRRAAAIAAVADTEQAAIEVTDLVRRGVHRAAAIDLPPEAEPIRAAIGPDVDRLRGLTGDARKQAMIESGYAMPHWPKPWGRDAGAIEQLVIEQEFAAAGIKRPGYGITSWIILTLIQHATPDQVARWVRPALNQDVTWCQLFSEPGAGSDAAGIRTRATRTDG